MPEGHAEAAARAPRGVRGSPPAPRGEGRPRRLRRLWSPGHHDGPDPPGGPPLLRGPPRRRPPAGPPVAPKGMNPARREPAFMAIAVKPAVPAAPAAPGAGARFEGLVLDFLSYLELERGLSRNTLNAYRTDLLQYGEYLAAHDKRRAAARARPTSPTSSPSWRRASGRPACSASTIHRKAACLRSFYKHLRRDELIGDDPTAALSAPRRAKKLPQVLNYAEVQKLLAAPRGRRADDAARPGAAGGDVRVRAAGLGDDRAGAGRRRPARGLPARPRQGLEGAAGAAGPPGDRRDPRLHARRPAEAGRRAPRAEAVRQLPRRPADPPGPLQDRPAPRPRRRARPAR